MAIRCLADVCRGSVRHHSVQGSAWIRNPSLETEVAEKVSTSSRSNQTRETLSMRRCAGAPRVVTNPSIASTTWRAHAGVADTHGEGLPGALVDDVAQLEPSSIGGLIGLEVDRPHFVGLRGSQALRDLGLTATTLAAGLDARALLRHSRRMRLRFTTCPSLLSRRLAIAGLALHTVSIRPSRRTGPSDHLLRVSYPERRSDLKSRCPPL
jgi:hypothetical protein